MGHGNNNTCKTCGEKFPYCGSCGSDGYSEDGFCSYKCKQLVRHNKIRKFSNKFHVPYKEVEEFLQDVED